MAGCGGWNGAGLGMGLVGYTYLQPLFSNCRCTVL